MNNILNPGTLTYLRDSKKNAFDMKDGETDPVETLIAWLGRSSFDLFSHNAPVVYLSDYRNNQYVFMSSTMKSLCGHDAQSFIEGGISYAISLFHKDDLRLYKEHIFPNRLKFLRSLPHGEHKQYLFSYNYRIKTREGDYISLLQRNTFIQSDAHGNPLMSLGVIHDISSYANPVKVIHTIDKFNMDNPCSKIETVAQASYYLEDQYKKFSSRERQVLFCMAQGLTSKEIADKLFISVHTVVNHRRNMQEKTHMPNAISLVAYSIKMNLI